MKAVRYARWLSKLIYLNISYPNYSMHTVEYLLLILLLNTDSKKQSFIWRIEANNEKTLIQ